MRISSNQYLEEQTVNREDFLMKIAVLYPEFFNQDRGVSSTAWLDGYRLIIPEDHIDFEKLYRMFLKEYSSVRTPPAPSFFTDYISAVTIKEELPPPPPLTEEEKAEREKAARKFFENMDKLIKQKTMPQDD